MIVLIVPRTTINGCSGVHSGKMWAKFKNTISINSLKLQHNKNGETIIQFDNKCHFFWLPLGLVFFRSKINIIIHKKCFISFTINNVGFVDSFTADLIAFDGAFIIATFSNTKILLLGFSFSIIINAGVLENQLCYIYSSVHQSPTYLLLITSNFFFV